MMSARYAPALCLLLAIALVPTVIHSYVGARMSDGREVRAIPVTLDGRAGSPTPRNAGWGQSHFESGDWFERSYPAGAGEVVLTAVRSYDLKRLYHHPELDIAYGTAFITHDVKRVGAASVPVNVMWTVDKRTVAVSVLRYEDEFVEHPYRLQMRTAIELMVSPRKPMTLFFATQTNVTPDAEVSSLPVTRVLLAAVEQLLAQRGASR
jgi:hypothetical protein